MPVVMQMHWPEITIDVYEQARERIGWEREAPEGGIVHVAWMGEDGFHVLDVWETAEDCERFAQEKVMPFVVGELGVKSEPKVTITPAHAADSPATYVEQTHTAASAGSS
jgi:hypothetical protein